MFPCIYKQSKKGLFKGLSVREKVWMSHADNVTDLPEGFEILAHTDNAPVAAYSEGKVYLPLHPEVVHTVHRKLL